jgi:hypothetical protein
MNIWPYLVIGLAALLNFETFLISGMIKQLSALYVFYIKNDPDSGLALGMTAPGIDAHDVFSGAAVTTRRAATKKMVFFLPTASPTASATPRPCYAVAATNTHGCTANGCTAGDDKGCIFGLPPKYCAARDCVAGQQGPAVCGGANPVGLGYWSCCCKGKLMQCVDCTNVAGGAIKCICSVDTGQACVATPTPKPTATPRPTPNPGPEGI